MKNLKAKIIRMIYAQKTVFIAENIKCIEGEPKTFKTDVPRNLLNKKVTFQHEGAN